MADLSADRIFFSSEREAYNTRYELCNGPAFIRFQDELVFFCFTILLTFCALQAGSFYMAFRFSF